MAQTEPPRHSPPEAPKRPRGILKNSNSFQQISPEASVSPTSSGDRPPIVSENAVADETTSNGRPPMHNRELSEKEITQMNTEINAGPGHRRTSSNPRTSISRRQSSQSTGAAAEQDEQNMRLKWDEANLYLNEGQMGGRMKIDEPKTPYVGQYNDADDDEDVSMLNAQDLAVDELEMDKSKKQPKKSRDADIPGLDLGEPELDPQTRRESDGENKVMVESDDMELDGSSGHGEKREEDMSSEEREKHKKFEEMRKRHYEMRDVKNLLGHGPEDLDIDDEDENENGRR